MDELNIGVTVQAGDARGELASLSGSIDAVESSTGRMNVSQQQASRLISSTERASRTFIASLKEEIASYGKARDELLAYRASQLGVADEAKPYIAQLKELSAANHDVGESSKYAEFQMRMMPAQFSQTFSSLATGQPVMQVLLQQGHQVVDMFGGVKEAVAATGRFLLKMLTPTTMVVGAVAALSGVLYAASKEQAEFQNAIKLTGDFAGTTEGQMRAYAAEISNVTTLTLGASKQIATGVAASGVITATAYRSVMAATAQYSAVTGKSAVDSVKYMVQLFQDPTRGAETLNRTMHLLTSTQIDYIRTLQQSGREGEAQKQLADDLTAKFSRMQGEMGYLQRDWVMLKKASSDAWDAMLGVGRTATPTERLASVRAELSRLQQQVSVFHRHIYDSTIAQLKREQADLIEQIKTNSEKASAQAKAAALDQEREQARATYATKTTAGQLAALNGEIEKYQRLMREDPGSSKLYQSLIDINRQKVYELTTGKALEQLDARYQIAAEALTRKRTAAITAENKALAELDAHYAAAAAAETKARQAAERSHAMTGSIFSRMTSGFDSSIAEKMRQLQIIPENVKQIQDALQKVADRADAARSAATKAYGQGVITSATEYHALLTKITAEEERQRVAVSALTETQQQLNDSFTYGARKGFQSYLDGLTSIAGESQHVMKQALDGITNQLVKFVTDGKLSFKDLGASILAELTKIAIQINITQALKSSWGSSMLSFFGMKFANGGVMSSPGLSAYSGSVVSSPTIFPFASGVGLMGEAGPEAILPLQRGANGKMGVVAQTVANGNGQSDQRNGPLIGEVHLHANDYPSFQKSKNQLASDLGSLIMHAQRRLS